TLLEGAVAGPERRIADLPLLSPHERALLLEQWATTLATPLPSFSLPDLFAAQVARTPDAIALAAEDHQFSYGALSARAGRLAAALQEHGVAVDTPVGVLLERGP